MFHFLKLFVSRETLSGDGALPVGRGLPKVALVCKSWTPAGRSSIRDWWKVPTGQHPHINHLEGGISVTPAKREGYLREPQGRAMQRIVFSLKKRGCNSEYTKNH